MPVTGTTKVLTGAMGTETDSEVNLALTRKEAEDLLRLLQRERRGACPASSGEVVWTHLFRRLEAALVS